MSNYRSSHPNIFEVYQSVSADSILHLFADGSIVRVPSIHYGHLLRSARSDRRARFARLMFWLLRTALLICGIARNLTPSNGAESLSILE